MDRLMTNRYASLCLLLCAAAIAACSNDHNGVQDITAPAVGAHVKFFNFAVGAPGVNFYADNQKVTAISTGQCFGQTDSTIVKQCLSSGIESTTGTGYGAAANGGLYNDVGAGAHTLTGKIAATTDKDLAISPLNTTVNDGTFYSYYTSGVYDATNKKADAFIVQDDLPTITDFTLAYVRFVNASANGGSLTLTGVNTATNASVTIGGPVAYKSANAFVPVPAGVYNLTVTGGPSTVTAANVSFVAGHVYSVAARGDFTSTVTANKPGLTATANR